MKEKVLVGDNSAKAQVQYLALKALLNSSPYNRKQIIHKQRFSSNLLLSEITAATLCPAYFLASLVVNIFIFYSFFSPELSHEQTCFPKSLAKRIAVPYKPISASPWSPFGYIKPSLPLKILLQEEPIACCSEEGDIALNAGVVQQGHLLPKASYKSNMALNITTIGLS